MRCFFRNAGAVLAMIWSGAAAAVAGPVSIRMSSNEDGPAAIVQADWQPVGHGDDWMALTARLIEAHVSWFPDPVTLQPNSPLAAPPPAPPSSQPIAIVIPEPSSAWLGIAGLGCACVVARVFNPLLKRKRGRQGRAT